MFDRLNDLVAESKQLLQEWQEKTKDIPWCTTVTESLAQAGVTELGTLTKGQQSALLARLHDNFVILKYESTNILRSLGVEKEADLSDEQWPIYSRRLQAVAVAVDHL